ncbi:hypothetical protein PC118_g6352 [Phytophthora cactorum]|uniref:Uncharacterized protein n=1 Tax=Phytophthora cactorum TaxID=29920 RepID=A0A8T1GEN0_9STRA|nr:hypothetical protein PC118_g6352 [Phytophthora cactorum]
MIKEENSDDPTLKNVAAKDLRLFLAKKEDGRWLDEDEAPAVALDDQGHPQGFKSIRVKRECSAVRQHTR